MQSRYGLDRRPIGRSIGVAAIIVVFVGALFFVARGLTASNETQTRLIEWNAVGPDRVDVTFQVVTDRADEVVCVVRAQDENRIDVGYGILTIPAGSSDDVIITTYALRTLAPAYTAELLGCATGEAPRVPGPQFPPGVVPPDQPYAP
jgi:hypothetical protein